MENYDLHLESNSFDQNITSLDANLDTPLSPNKLKPLQRPFKGCQRAFRFKSEKERHLIAHNNDRPYLCHQPFCNKTFKRQDALRVHMHSHSERPQFIPGL